MTDESRSCGRRAFLAGLGLFLATGAAPAAPYAFGALPPDRVATRFDGIGTRFLWLRVAGTGEECHAAFRTEGGALDDAGLRRLSWAFRDWKAGDRAIWMDHRLFDLLAHVQTEATNLADFPVRVSLTSGFRTAARNATIEGAARNSQHLKGRAADFTLTGVPVAEAARIGTRLGAHGVGRYLGFVHLDVGPPGRRW